MIIHPNITGFPGAGKTKAMQIVIVRPIVKFGLPAIQFLTRPTTRDIRPDDVPGWEYDFLSDSEYDRREKRGMMLAWPLASGEKVRPDGTRYRRGTYHPNYLPVPTKHTKVRISAFGARVSPELQQILTEMRNIFLEASDDILIKRIRGRRGSQRWSEERQYCETIKLYREELHIIDNFTHIIHTDDMTPEEVADEIERISGLDALHS